MSKKLFLVTKFIFVKVASSSNAVLIFLNVLVLNLKVFFRTVVSNFLYNEVNYC